MRSVCLYTESPEPSGVGEHMLALAERLRRRYDLALVCAGGESDAGLLRRAAALGLGTAQLDAPEALEAWLAAHDADLVHLHAGIGWEGHAGAQAAARAGVPVLRTEHLPYLLTDPDQQAAYRDAVAGVDLVVCVSDGARASYEAAGVPAAKLRVVRNGIDAPAVPGRAEARARLGFDGEPLVLTVGRFTRQKGYDVLLDAVPAVLDHVPAARFLWAGDGLLWGEMRRAVAERGLAEHVLLLGRRGDVPDLMAAADLFVLPSRFEGLPLVVLEAFAAGLPTVATRVVGTEEAVRSGETGRLVPPERPAALAVAIVSTLLDPAEADGHAEAGRRDFDARWTARRMAADTARVYDELLTPHLSLTL